LIGDVENFQKQQHSDNAENSISNSNPPKERSTDKNPRFIAAVRQQELRNYQQIYEDRYNALRKLNNEINEMII
jgi:hypothetical protein